jgi:hypothetical protein
MAVKRFQPNLQGADLEKIKAVCYPCTSQNDCSRKLNNEQATVESCNGAYNLFGIDPPPADYIAPKKVGKSVGPPERVAKGVSSTNSRQGGLGTVLFAAFLPMSSYSSSCILSLCSIYFVVSAASKK